MNTSNAVSASKKYKRVLWFLTFVLLKGPKSPILSAIATPLELVLASGDKTLPMMCTTPLVADRFGTETRAGPTIKVPSGVAITGCTAPFMSCSRAKDARAVVSSRPRTTARRRHEVSSQWDLSKASEARGLEEPASCSA